MKPAYQKLNVWIFKSLPSTLRSGEKETDFSTLTEESLKWLMVVIGAK